MRKAGLAADPKDHVWLARLFWFTVEFGLLQTPDGVRIYGGGIASARGLAANDFMYWEVMRRAVERGCRVFDFGRSKVDTGSYRFKKHWGFEPTPLSYEYHLVKASEMPDLNPNNPKYRFFINAWKRLPVGISRAIGPWLARGLA